MILGGPKVHSAEENGESFVGVQWIGAPGAEDPETGEVSPVTDDPDNPLVGLSVTPHPTDASYGFLMITADYRQLMLGEFLDEDTANYFLEIFEALVRTKS